MTSSARLAVAAVIGAVAATVITVLVSSGAPQMPPPGLPQPGMIVSWSLPIANTLSDVLGLLTIGFLLVAIFLLPNGKKLEGLSVQAVRIASRFAWLWLVAIIWLYWATVADLYARPLWGVDTNQLLFFVQLFAQGRAMAIEFVFVLIVAIWSRWTLRPEYVAIMFGFTLLAVAPIALTGHAATAGPHMLAVASLLMHMLAAYMWVGGLIALTWVAIRGSKRLEPAVNRYSALALWCYASIAISGFVNVAVRFNTLEHFQSIYGALVLVKLAALLALGVFGWWQRRRIITQALGFKRLAISEVCLMLVTVAVSVVLSRTETPRGDDIYGGQVETLLSGPVPPAPTWQRLLIGWEPNGFGLLVVGFGSAFYILGLMIMRRRGDHWQIGRTISWFVGLIMIGWATFGGLGDYAAVTFKMHMISHMMIAMIAPIFLVLGAPITLALRTLPGPRVPGEHSPRSLLNAFLHSWISRIYTHPVVAAMLFVGSLFAIYFTDLFEALMRTHTGHAFMEFHFMMSGILFYYVVMGVDPSPRPLPPFMRVLLLMITLPFHAFFSVALMSANVVYGEDYFRMINAPWMTDLLQDQVEGASFSWAIGEVPMILVILAIFWQWFRADQRESRRLDRAADRDDDAALREYNAYLQSLKNR